MDILFVATELAPMVRPTETGEVVTSLSKALRLLGHKVTIALPRHPAIEAAGVLLARRLTPLTLRSTTGETEEVTLYDGRLASGVDLLLVDAERGGPGWATLADAGSAATFVRAVVEVLKQRCDAGAPFDLVHAHDANAAMALYLLRTQHAALRMPLVLTVHRTWGQRIYPRNVLAPLGLSEDHFHPERLEFYGNVSFMKAGILSAHAITTVSPTYGREVLTPELGEKYDGVLRTRQDRITGIANGIDYAISNPTTDPAIVARYDAEDASNKGRCKSAAQKDLGLSVEPDRPFCLYEGPLTRMAGADILAEALPRILRSDVSVAIVGSGDPEIQAAIQAAIAGAEGRAVLLPEASDAAVRRLYAGADLAWFPARVAPCGFGQLVAQRYGAIPVARRTGGLADTIVDADAGLATGSGFLFESPTAADFFGAQQRALTATRSPAWGALRRRVMRLDLGWDRPARRYVQIYRVAIADVAAG